jgi:site-specific DNA recombinase
MDRFARGAVFAVGAVLQKLGDAQVRVYQYLKGAFVRLDGEHALITAIEMFGNRNEALKTSARTKEKLKHKDEEGTITNLTPYGFKNVRRRRSDGAVGIFIERKGTDGVAVPHETEHPILVEMADLFLKLGSYNAVANNLNARKVPAPRGGPLGWSSESVRRILGNTAYRGTVKRGQLPTGEVAGSLVRIKADPDDVRSYDRPEYRVWDDETVAKIDALMKARARTTTWSPRARRHLASGFLRCASCGGGVSIHKHATYGCQRRSKGCKGIGYRKEVVVDAAIVSACFGLLADEVINKAREIIAQALDVRAEHDHRLVEVDRLKREIATAERRVKGSQEMAAESDGAERAHHRAALRDQLGRLETLRGQLADVEAQEPGPDPKTLLANFDERVRELRDTLSKGGLEAQPAVAAILGGERLTVHRRDDGRWDLVGETDLQVLAGGKPEVTAR